jgi:DNA-binding response OmpR family regulator
MERRSSYRALVVEDDGAILNLVKIVLERENFTVEGVKSGTAAIQLLKSIAYDLLIVDLMYRTSAANNCSATSRRPSRSTFAA